MDIETTVNPVLHLNIPLCVRIISLFNYSALLLLRVHRWHLSQLVYKQCKLFVTSKSVAYYDPKQIWQLRGSNNTGCVCSIWPFVLLGIMYSIINWSMLHPWGCPLLYDLVERERASKKQQVSVSNEGVKIAETPPTLVPHGMVCSFNQNTYTLPQIIGPK